MMNRMLGLLLIVGVMGFAKADAGSEKLDEGLYRTDMRALKDYDLKLSGAVKPVLSPSLCKHHRAVFELISERDARGKGVDALMREMDKTLKDALLLIPAPSQYLHTSVAGPPVVGLKAGPCD